MQICFFEDKKFDNLYPISYLRPVFHLKCGQTNLAEKIIRKFKNVKVTYFVRDYLEAYMKEKLGASNVNNLDVLKQDDCLFINGRWLFIDAKLELNGTEEVGVSGDDLVYARVNKQNIAKYGGANFEQLLSQIKINIKNVKVEAYLIEYPWNLVHENPRAIEDDFKFINKGGVIEGKFAPQSVIYGDKNKVYIAKNAEIQPFVTLDTNGGSIIIDEDVIIFPNSRIEGPTAIGKGTQIFGANIRTGTALGPVCRVGGEVEDSIIHGYSNKYHDGFLGHAYIGEWVNLGALTTNSDLKNDYTTVSLYMKGELMDSKDTKVGCFIGDHTKTSIGTYFNTGTITGIMCNLVGSGGVLPKYIPSFTWFFNNRFFKGYGLKSMLDTAKMSMSRRKKEMSKGEEELLGYLYDTTKSDRNYWIKKKS
ncbi:MAG: putative sugar nucleotidyl transferase [Candidatus Firestonebacteria bacterium]